MFDCTGGCTHKSRSRSSGSLIYADKGVSWCDTTPSGPVRIELDFTPAFVKDLEEAEMCFSFSFHPLFLIICSCASILGSSSFIIHQQASQQGEGAVCVCVWEVGVEGGGSSISGTF